MNDPIYLITGAAGFIGSHLAETLLVLGARVIGLDNFDSFYDREIKRRNIEEALRREGYRFVEGDIRDTDLIEKLLVQESVGTVVHLAARAGVRPSIENPMVYQSMNVEGTTSILEAMRRQRVRRLLCASSSSVYGNAPSVPFRETDNVDQPISPYAATKKACELLCHTFHHLFGIETACLRFFTVYGPRQRPDMAIHKFTRMIAAGEEITMYGDGSTSRDYTYIDDIVQGILAIDRNFKGYEVINLGESRTTSLRKLIEMISEAVGRTARVRVLPIQQGDVLRTYADISRARSLGYDPTTQIEVGVKRFVEWYREVSDRGAHPAFR